MLKVNVNIIISDINSTLLGSENRLKISEDISEKIEQFRARGLPNTPINVTVYWNIYQEARNAPDIRFDLSYATDGDTGEIRDSMTFGISAGILQYITIDDSPLTTAKFKVIEMYAQVGRTNVCTRIVKNQ